MQSLDMRSSSNLGQLKNWFANVDWLLCSNRAADNTQNRAGRLLEAAPKQVHKRHLACTSIEALTFSWSDGTSSAATTLPWNLVSRALIDEIEKIEFKDKTKDTIKEKIKILVDMTDADWEFGFFVLPALYAHPLLEIQCAFTSPLVYPQASDKNAHQPIDTHGIRQPPGLIRQLCDEPTNGKHVFFLGFDHDRAQKFINNYNWADSDCVAVIGDPPYIPDGDRISREANPLLLHRLKMNGDIRSVAAADPYVTFELLQNLHRDYQTLDIILQGTSPMTLGAIWFYLHLPVEDRGEIRFLHDFPVRMPGRAEGIGQTYIFDCPAARPFK